jgi:hypothetical protein
MLLRTIIGQGATSLGSKIEGAAANLRHHPFLSFCQVEN